MTPKQTLKQINDLTASLVGLSLSNRQHYPATRGPLQGDCQITINNDEGMTVALKNVPYRDIYVELEKSNCFNIMMLDGGLMTFRYRFQKGIVIEHSLTYFPSPDLEHFQNDPELYLLDEIYAEALDRNIVAFPLRFDYNDDPGRFEDVHHPFSHLTLGQYRNCRIPVCSPVSPLAFGRFVLRSFYNTSFRQYSDKIPAGTNSFHKTITDSEKKVLHVVCGR